MILNRHQQVQNDFAAAVPSILEITRDHETAIETMIDMGANILKTGMYR